MYLHIATNTAVTNPVLIYWSISANSSEVEDSSEGMIGSPSPTRAITPEHTLEATTDTVGMVLMHDLIIAC